MPAVVDPRPNVVLIVLDTMRQGRMGCYGYDRETTPNLSALADSARFYDHAYSTTSWTLPAHASLFTGQFPATHGATQEHWVLAEAATTLAEVYRDAGYATHGIHANPILSAGAGYEQGFDHYERSWQTDYDVSVPNRTLELFRDAIAGRAPDAPLFSFVNIIEPHSPYDSARQYRNHFVSDPTQTISRNMWAPYYVGEKEFAPEELQHLSELYDGETLYTDYLVGEMIGILQAAGLWENTILVVTSDHGENFGEHGHYDHVFSLYETTVRVPMILRYPAKVKPGRDDRAVQITDVFPTLLELCDISRVDTHQGVSLLQETETGGRPIVCEYYYPQQTLEVYKDLAKRSSPNLDPYRRRLRTITAEGFKYHWADKGPEALYAITSDPHETTNLIDVPEHQATLERLRSLLGDWVREHATAATTPGDVEMRSLGEDTVEALQSLGYLE